MLAKLGQRVLVLEQHYVPGGFTHSFKQPGGYHWDVGVHAVGEVTERSLTGRLLRHLSDDRLRWSSLGASYDEFDFPGGLHIEFPDTPQRFREHLIDAFPREQAAIDGYLHRVREVAGAMRTQLVRDQASSPSTSWTAAITPSAAHSRSPAAAPDRRRRQRLPASPPT
ncbi:MAG: FAD-dependent oxidoreductase [Nannocystis sp.]|nr:FAD-dependent oxidoreductase [Nannocystis sp.]